MERRYQLRKNGFICEAPFTIEGLNRLLEIRKMLPNIFKRSRIYSVLQAQPDDVVVGRVYPIDSNVGWQPEHCKEGFIAPDGRRVP